MKIFKIKFDSKMPTTRKVTVGKDDDFGLAIQIDDMQSQGPAKLLYAGQEVEANKDLIEGYNVFLLKAVKDSTISIKDIDSQVTFTVEISIKKTDVVELGGTGGGGEAVWEFDGICTYSIPGVLSVDGCYQIIKSPGSMTFMPENGYTAVGVYQDTISLSSYIMCLDAECISMRANSTTTIASNNDLQIIHGCFDQPVFKASGCNVYVGDSGKTTSIQGNGINICTTAGGMTINATGSSGICINANCIRMMYGCGWQVFNANPNNNCIAIGNCSKTLELDASKLAFYVPNGNVDVNATNLNIAAYTTYFSNCTNYHSVYAISQSGYCGTSYQTINYPISGKTTITWDGVSYGFKNKTLAIILSAIENTFLTGQDITNFNMGQAETNAFNKLTAIFSA